MTTKVPSQAGEMASKLTSLTKQLSDITDHIQENKNDLKNYPDEWKKLTEATANLGTAVQQPMDVMLRSFVSVAQMTVIRIFVQWNVFANIPLEGHISYEKLAASVSTDVNIIDRLSRMLVSTGMLKQVDKNNVMHTELSRAFAKPSPLLALVRMGFDQNFKSLAKMPEYFNKYGLREPAGRYGTISAYASGDANKTVWEHVNSDPELMSAFMTSMVAMSSRLGVIGSYDLTWVVPEISKSTDRAIVVDVGGGHGHALHALRQTVPEIPMSRCVVEDLEPVVKEAKEKVEGDLKDAQFMPTDFHKEQPVKGALVYYIRRCLHDYGDEESIEILQRIRDAMAPDSRLLIAEVVMDEQPDPIVSMGDVVMATLGGKERTADGFEYIASRAGLKVTRIEQNASPDVSIVECVPVLK